MRPNINLASQKYEDVQEFYFRWGATTALLAALAVLLGVLAYFNYSGLRRSSATIAKLQSEVNDLDKQRSDLIAVAHSPENRDVTQQKDFWNDQIYLRSLSWTQLLTDLEKIMPQRAYLDSVEPSLTPDNRMKLTLTIAGENHDNGLEVVRKMEKSERFRSPYIRAEGLVQQHGNPSVWKFQVETFYTGPPSGAGSTAASKEGL